MCYLYIRADAPYKILTDMRKAPEPVKLCGTTGEQFQALTKRIMNHPPAVLQRVKKIFA